jgi:hypothetical protein
LDQQVKLLVFRGFSYRVVPDRDVLDIDHTKGLIGNALPVHHRDGLADARLGDEAEPTEQFRVSIRARLLHGCDDHIAGLHFWARENCDANTPQLSGRNAFPA